LDYSSGPPGTNEPLTVAAGGPLNAVRRVTFDLTGFAADACRGQAFLKDNRPDAYPRLAERLLASPRFERMGTWLPLLVTQRMAHQGNDTSMFYPVPIGTQWVMCF
jgi:hypothetical protein